MPALKTKTMVFDERGKPEYPEKNLSELTTEPTTNQNCNCHSNNIDNTMNKKQQEHKFNLLKFIYFPALIIIIVIIIIIIINFI